ncbi:ABC transporter permease [Niallia sp. Marseille-Q9988]
MKIIDKWKDFLFGFISIILLWYAASLIINKPILPAPKEVLSNLYSLVSQDIYIHLGYSLVRIFVGIAISVCIGLLVGVLMGQSKQWNKILNPIIYFTYPIPKISLLPAVMLIFGLKESSKIIMIVLIIVFQIIIAVRDSVKDIPKETYYILRCLGTSRWREFKEITLPAALSSILSSIRIALGTATSILFFTEIYGTEYGMGYYIMDAWMRINYLDMYSGIIVLSLVGFLLFVLIDLMESTFLKWRNTNS